MKVNEAVKIAKPEKELESRVKKLLLGRALTLSELADRLNCAPKQAQAAVDRLGAAGHQVKLAADTVSIDRRQPVGNNLVVDARDFFDGEWLRFGAMGDTHLYSKYARLDALNAMYDIYAREGITRVFHTGNAIDGESRLNKFDLVGPSGIGRQVEYFVNEYPVRKGVETWFITGDDHEGWFIQREGINIGQHMQDMAEQAGRTDLKWIGHVEADVHLKSKKGSAWLRIMHPGGGSAYATSYTEQKLVEALQGGEKPHIMLVGHYHKFNHGYPREVHTVQTGCFQDPTIFLRKMKIQAHVGGCLVRCHQADTGEINRFNVEFVPFYDRKFYSSKDKYRRW